MPPKFDFEKAFICAKLSGLSYMGREGFAISALCEGLDATYFFEVGDTQCFIVHNSDNIFCVFRGTESVGDWRTNFNFDRKETIVGSVHDGFASALESIWYQVESKIVDIYRCGRRAMWILHSWVLDVRSNAT